MNKIIANKSKYFLAALSLATSLSLGSCAYDNSSDYSEITSRVEDSKDMFGELPTEEDEKEVEIVIPQDKIEVKYTQDIYDMDETYLNISLFYRISVSSIKDEDMERNISLSDLVSIYGCRLDYDKDTNTITKENLKKAVDDIQTRLTETKARYQISRDLCLDNIGVISGTDLKDGKIYGILLMSELNNKINEDSSSTEVDDTVKNNFIKRYEDFIYEKDGKLYISIIDYTLLNKSISYTQNLEDIFTNLPSATDKEIDTYKKGVLKTYNINLDDDKLRFDPNNMDDIKDAFNAYIDDNISLSYLYYDKKYTKDNIDYQEPAMLYIAMNEELLTDDTILTIVDNYMPKYKGYEVEEIRKLCIKYYGIFIGQEALVAKRGCYNALKQYTEYHVNRDDRETYKQKLTLDNLEKTCQELYLLQQIYVGLGKSNSIKDVITDVYTRRFIDINVMELVSEEFPSYMFEANKNRDLKLLSCILADNYRYNDEDSVYQNIDIAKERVNELTNAQKTIQ